MSLIKKKLGMPYSIIRVMDTRHRYLYCIYIYQYLSIILFHKKKDDMNIFFLIFMGEKSNQNHIYKVGYHAGHPPPSRYKF